MVFSSQVFLFYFLPAALVLYYLLPRRAKNPALTLASYVFYGWANPSFVFLMLGTTAVNYACGLAIAGRSSLQKGGQRTSRQKAALVLSVVVSLSALAFFKYFNFGIDSYNGLMTALGLGHLKWEAFFRITLPLGISFYTFQSMSYTIDVYRGDAAPCSGFLDFACFVAMFPQLVAGPIVRFQEVSTQLVDRTITKEKLARGVSFIAFGLAKKVLIADSCGKIADVCFDAASVPAPDAWFGALAYAFQIYFDFSAYSDMAIGLGLMLGFVFPKNFDSPYLSTSITEFWQRWHLSLSTWLRDYLYIPLGGNRKGPRRTYANLAAVMLLGGLWHGAAFSFIVWGGIHGALLAIERMQGKKSFYRSLPKPLRIAFTFLAVLVAWVFFRARDMPSALSYLQNMFGLGESGPASDLASGLIYQPYYVLFFCLAAVVAWAFPQTADFTRKMTWTRAACSALVLIVAILVMVSKSYNPFIYFIF